MEFKWSDVMKNRSRTPRLFVKLPGGNWEEFRGKSLPGVIAVKSYNYQKNGKWSGGTYVLIVNSAIVAQVLQPFDYFQQTWADHAAAITILAGEYDYETAARELLPLVDSESYREAVKRANENEAAANDLL